MAYINGKEILFSQPINLYGASGTEVAEVKAKLEEVEAIAKGANQAVSFGNYSTMITAFNALPSDKYNCGQNIMIVTVNVPDLWVSSVTDQGIEYTYTSDEDFVSALKESGSVQVGYYLLSALETQKVDLTEYVKNTDYASSTQYGVVRAESWGAVTVDNKGTLMANVATNADIDTRYRHRLLRCSDLDYAILSGITGKKLLDDGKTYTCGNQTPLTDEEKGYAHRWLGVPTTYDELKDKPFYDDSIDLIATEEGLSVDLTFGREGYYPQATLQTNRTYTLNQLLGASASYNYAGISDQTTISSDTVIDNTADGITIKLANDIYIFVAYTTDYKPSLAEFEFPQVGVYFSFFYDGDKYEVCSLKNGKSVKKLDNKYLDLENNDVIKALDAKIDNSSGAGGATIYEHRIVVQAYNVTDGYQDYNKPNSVLTYRYMSSSNTLINTMDAFATIPIKRLWLDMTDSTTTLYDAPDAMRFNTGYSYHTGTKRLIVYYSDNGTAASTSTTYNNGESVITVSDFVTEL